MQTGTLKLLGGRYLSLATGSVLTVLLLSGCAVTPELAPKAKQPGMMQLAAADFASNLASLVDSAPAGRRLYINENTSVFARQLQQALTASGFVIEPKQRAGVFQVDYRISSLQTAEGLTAEFDLAVGPISMARSYANDAEGAYAISALATRYGVAEGAKAAGGAGESAVAHAVTKDPFAGLVAQQPSGQHKDSVKALPVSGSAVAKRENFTPDLPSDLSGVERRNIYKTRRSSFADFVRGYDGVTKQMLAFPNDSLHMSSAVANELQRLVQLFRSESDVFSVIGCSHGNTALENGNALLAIGRSKRVQQHLVELGVPANRILDEGCWAPVHFDEMMPRRGVVIELKRKSV